MTYGRQGQYAYRDCRGRLVPFRLRPDPVLQEIALMEDFHPGDRVRKALRGNRWAYGTILAILPSCVGLHGRLPVRAVMDWDRKVGGLRIACPLCRLAKVEE